MLRTRDDFSIFAPAQDYLRPWASLEVIPSHKQFQSVRLKATVETAKHVEKDRGCRSLSAYGASRLFSQKS
jgi:hypothetical protein